MDKTIDVKLIYVPNDDHQKVEKCIHSGILMDKAIEIFHDKQNYPHCTLKSLVAKKFKFCFETTN